MNPVVNDDLEFLRENVLHESVEILSSFHLPERSRQQDFAISYQSALVHFEIGKSYFHLGQYARALHTFNAALSLIDLKITDKPNPSFLVCCEKPNNPKDPGDQFTQTPGPERLSIDVEQRTQSDLQIQELGNEIHLFIAESYLAMNNNIDALKSLKHIAYHRRSVRINVALGEAYCRMGVKNAAIQCYTDALNQCPQAMQVAVKLAQLGEEPIRILSIVNQKKDFSSLNSFRALSLYITSICSHAQMKYDEAIKNLLEANQHVSNNIHIHLALANAYFEKAIGFASTRSKYKALYWFQSVRKLDPYVTTYMDKYAILLYEYQDKVVLAELAAQLFESNRIAPEGWIAASLHAQVQENEKNAIDLASRACFVLNGCHHTAALIFLKNNSPGPALSAIENGSTVNEEMSSVSLLVRAEAYLLLSRYKESLVISNQAIKMLPESPHILCLIGRVLKMHADDPDKRKKARSIFHRSLQTSKSCTEAAVVLSEMMVEDGETDAAIELLRTCLKECSSYSHATDVQDPGIHFTENTVAKKLNLDDSRDDENGGDDESGKGYEAYESFFMLSKYGINELRCQLGQILAKVGRYQEALTEYNEVLGLYPSHKEARLGLRRLEKIMKGADPDGPDAEMNNEYGEDDVEIDSDE